MLGFDDFKAENLAFSLIYHTQMWISCVNTNTTVIVVVQTHISCELVVFTHEISVVTQGLHKSNTCKPYVNLCEGVLHTVTHGCDEV